MKRLLFILCAWMMMAMSAHAEEKALQTSYDLTIGDYEAEFFEAGNDVYMLMHSVDEAMTIRLDIIVEPGQQFFTNGKTYTWDEMLHPFCSVYVRDEYRDYKFADASFTWTKDEQGLEHIAGSATDSLGNTYTFHYDVLPYIPTGDTLDIAFEHSLRLEHDEYWFFSGTEGDYYILLTLINETGSPAGHYTAENMDMGYSYIDRPGEGGDHEIFLFHDADITITEAANDTFKIEGFIAAMDGNVYCLHLFYMEPKPTIKQELNATNLYINTDYLYGMIGAFQVVASNDTHQVKLAFSPMTEDLNIYDTFTITNVSPHLGYVTVYNAGEEEISDVYKGTVTISRTENGAEVSGTILCYNNIEYTLHLSCDVPEKTSEKELTIDGMALKVSSQGAWQISGYSADETQYVSLVFNGFGIEGTYNFVEMSRDYSYIVTDIIWDGEYVNTYNYYELKAADLSVTLNETDSVVTVTGTIIAQRSDNIGDVLQFTVHLTSKPITEDVAIVRSEATATKRMENDMIVIEKNGMKYTITGQIIH